MPAAADNKDAAEDSAADQKPQAQSVTTNIPEDLKQFYDENNIQFRKFSELQSQGQKNASEKERVAKELKDLTVPAMNVTLLSSLRWFNLELTERGFSSDAINAVKAQLLGQDQDESQGAPNRLEGVEELLALSYLCYLDQNNYIKADKRYLFGDRLIYDTYLAGVGDSHSE